MVAGFECCNGPPNFTGDSVATGRAYRARQIGGQKTEEEAHPLFLQNCWLEVGCRKDNHTS